ncbi:hypothetical protein MRB53_030987 [Persea americana]|uniref:Uncharacterized protein n=1 Tax=Persea americana TaxID=3435 RepID=A0ACC2KN19_PERAE|nr:hypothetical protein MRB53_030987 [Persea americana]
MIYTVIDTFYLTDEQLDNSPSRKDGIDESMETTLRIYGCDLIQESGILLRLPQAVMATGQVLFHRFYCKKSFAGSNVKRVAASCVWLASKLEESPRKSKHVLMVFHRMECRRENLPIEDFDPFSKKYSELKMDLSRTERLLLREMGFICHVEHPHKFISNYLATLEILELRQEAWNLANDSLRTSLCVRFKSEVVACGVVYAAACRFQIPLPESPPWWKAFDADKSGIEEVCRVLAHLYSLPKAQYVHVCKDGDSWDSQTQASKENLSNGAANATKTPKVVGNQDAVGFKDALIKVALDKLKESKKSDDEIKPVPEDGDGKEETAIKSKPGHKTDANGERNREKERERAKVRDRGRDSDWEREQEKEQERERDKLKERSHRAKEKGKDSGYSEKSRHHSSRGRSKYPSSYSSSHKKEKLRHRHHPYA